MGRLKYLWRLLFPGRQSRRVRVKLTDLPLEPLRRILVGGAHTEITDDDYYPLPE